VRQLVEALNKIAGTEDSILAKDGAEMETVVNPAGGNDFKKYSFEFRIRLKLRKPIRV
jgi:hypothetical protein